MLQQEEAVEETQRMLNVYADFCEEALAIPVIKGQKTEKEKFAGAEQTYTIESMMHDGKALQSGTAHYFGDGFARAFGIQYTDKNNELQYVHQTSWGMSTRIIGAIIMIHGDNNGLVLPPNIAPIQVVVIPVAANKPGVLEKAAAVADSLKEKFTVKFDDSDKSPGWKFSEYEMKGIPVRVEIGPRDLENNQAVLVRRDNNEKITVSLDNISSETEELLKTIQHDMYERAKQLRESRIYTAHDFDEMKKISDEHTGFIKAMWCGDLACEEKIKDEAGLSSRCMPFEQEHVSDKCVCCGKPAKTMVYWGKAY